MAAGSSSERCRLLVGGSVTRKAGWRRDTVNSGSGIRGRDARKAGAHDHEKSKEISTRQYLQIRERRGLVREILPHSRRPSEARSTRPNFRNRRAASTGRVGRHCRGIARSWWRLNAYEEERFDLLGRLAHPPGRAIIEPMQNILPVVCFIAGFALAWLIWHGKSAARAADLQARLETERQSAAEKMALLEDTREKLSDAFKALSADALARNSQSFLELAGATLAKTQETARGDLELRQQAIADMVTPVRESLDKVDHKIQELEKARAGAYAGLNEQVRSLIETQSQLRGETGKLVTALRTPSARGRWGEIQLRRVVEMAGMLEYCDFTSQTTLFGEEGRLRPDLLVKLPAGKTIVVDAKTPLDGYLQAIEAPDEATRSEEHTS